MSRGWESKDVESQIAEREWKGKATPPPSEAERKRRSLELSRTALRHDIENAKHPRHREMLEAAMRHLEEQISRLDEIK